MRIDEILLFAAIYSINIYRRYTAYIFCFYFSYQYLFVHMLSHTQSSCVFGFFFFFEFVYKLHRIIYRADNVLSWMDNVCWLGLEFNCNFDFVDSRIPVTSFFIYYDIFLYYRWDINRMTTANSISRPSNSTG